MAKKKGNREGKNEVGKIIKIQEEYRRKREEEQITGKKRRKREENKWTCSRIRPGGSFVLSCQ